VSGGERLRAAGAPLALAAGLGVGLAVHALGPASYEAEQLLQDLVGGAVLGLVVWIGLVTLRRSRP
jgi:hypothetical protein